MRGVRRRWSLALSILAYMTLDLSLAGMPGAFVFDLSDSVECTRDARGRTPDVVAIPAQADGAALPPHPPVDPAQRLTQADRVDRRARSVRARPRRTYVDPAPSSEDPH
jgi:hypothetical protein